MIHPFPCFIMQKLNSLLESLMEADTPLINTGVLATSPAQFTSLWAIREGLTEAMSKEGKAYKYDISVPLHKFREVIDTTREHVESLGLLREGGIRHVVGYGHVGDGGWGSPTVLPHNPYVFLQVICT